MILVAKAKHEPRNGDVDYVEVLLPEFRGIFAREGRFAYAWTFNPDDDAIAALRQNLPLRQGLDETWLYLVGRQPYHCPIRMRIVDFHHDRQRLHCPMEWQAFCINEVWCMDHFPGTGPIHLWFLVDRIKPIETPVDVRRFIPFFNHKYRMYGRNSFGFFRDR